MKKVLLDTSGYTSLLAGSEDVLDAIANADTVYMPVFVLGELFAGFRGGNREAENRKRLSDFMGKSTVHLLPAGEQTSEVFGELYHRLKTAGTPMPMNDVWIAAQAVETGSYVITRDKHFDRVPGLLLCRTVK